MPRQNPELDSADLETATRKLVEVVKEGLEHGFFECAITGEITNGGARCMIVKAGKSYRFKIRPKRPENG